MQETSEDNASGEIITYLEGLHVKQMSDFRLAIPLLFQRRSKDVEKFMGILRADKQTKKETADLNVT